MKKVEGFLYEEGDYVLVTAGYNKDMVGIVQNHDSLEDDVEYIIPELGDEADSWYRDDYKYSPTKYLKHLTKAEAEKHNETRKFLKVDTLDDVLRVKGKTLEVGCQDISFADAQKIADFIKEHCKIVKKPAAKKAVKKKVAKKR